VSTGRCVVFIALEVDTTDQAHADELARVLAAEYRGAVFTLGELVPRDADPATVPLLRVVDVGSAVRWSVLHGKAMEVVNAGCWVLDARPTPGGVPAGPDPGA
jgi:hypothetical protein